MDPMANESSALVERLLRNSEDMVRATEGTKMAMIEQAKASGQVAETLRQVADTNAKQTEAVNKIVEDRKSWDIEKAELKALHQKQIDKLQKYLIIAIVALFLAVGGTAIVKTIHSLGLFGGII